MFVKSALWGIEVKKDWGLELGLTIHSGSEALKWPGGATPSGRVGGGGGLVEGCDSPPMRRNPGRRHQVLLGSQDPGTDSDTNSHCALIFCEEGVKAVGVPGSREEAAAGTNGNNNYEMGELGRRCRT
ncbi:hypothetical protein AAG570_000360 [Ranatra chinensis]|uniref:Uncharacterized protein n=1 Tax=Ranatra chinensis TaxID=642074 RepID=A0ABD0ZDQ9_9HEMI